MGQIFVRMFDIKSVDNFPIGGASSERTYKLTSGNPPVNLNMPVFTSGGVLEPMGTYYGIITGQI